MKNLTDFLNESIFAKDYFDNDMYFNAEKLAKDIKANKNKMPKIKHCSIVTDNVYTIDSDEGGLNGIANLFIFETNNPECCILVYLPAEGMEDTGIDNVTDGFIAEIDFGMLTIAPKSDINNIVKSNTTYPYYGQLFRVRKGTFEQFISDLCKTVNMYASEFAELCGEKSVREICNLQKEFYHNNPKTSGNIELAIFGDFKTYAEGSTATLLKVF